MLDSAPCDPCMVHLASRVTPEVSSFLVPATTAMARQGLRQVVIVLDDPTTAGLLERFHPDVQLRRVPCSGNLLVDLSRLKAVMKAVLRDGHPVEAIHLHGVLPCLVASRVVRSLRGDTRVYFSPHASKLLGPLNLAGRWLVRLAQLISGRGVQLPIASVGTDVGQLSRLMPAPVALVESPVPSRFFGVARSEAPRPLIVAGGRVTAGDDALNMFTRFAVLLADAEEPPQFVWLGRVSEDQRARLRTAGVWLAEFADEVERARLLSEAWIYIAPAGGRGVPVGLAEALASGTPCIAADTPFQRHVVRDGTTGLLYRREEQALRHIASLLDSPELRRQFGSAARRDAQARFDDAEFRERLIRAYRSPNVFATTSPGEPVRLPEVGS